MTNKTTNTQPFKVKCVDDDYAHLTIGKEYDVVGNGYGVYQVKNDNDELEYYVKKRFEIVETPKDKQEFSVGDKVYVGLTGKIAQVTEIIDDDVVNIANKNNEVRVLIPHICHATQENYEMLCKLYQHIEFEQPPKEITGSDLTKWMFERGDFAVVCKCSNIGEYSAIASSPLRLITEYSKGRFLDNTGRLWGYAVPCDPKTNLPLTEDVLNDIN